MPQDDNREFVLLMMQNERRLFSYILTLVPNWNDADELLQQTTVRLWEQFGDFEPGSNFLAWSRKVAYYEVLTHRKRRERKRMVFSDDLVGVLAQEAADLDKHVDSRLQALNECVDSLAAGSRSLLSQCYADGARVADVAKQLGRSMSSVYQALYRIRLALRDCINMRLAEELSE